MAISSKRAGHLAWAAMVLSIIFFIVTLLISLWSGFLAIYAVSWFILSSVLIWFVLAIQFQQRSLAEQESLDIQHLAKSREKGTIFQPSGEKAGMFAVAGRRLKVFEKWFIPVFSAIIGIYELAISFYLYSLQNRFDQMQRPPLICAVFMAAIAFVSFLISRYATGMSAEPKWKPLRAGGSILLGSALLCFLLSIGLALAVKTFIMVEILSWVITILLFLLGLETLLNVVMDIYRPRLKHQYSRSAFDSRILGIINEPGGIFRSAAGAIDYQFGFQVSQTWFYRLIERAILPLVLFGIVVLYLSSCFVVLNPDEEAIIERFGNPVNIAGQVRLIGPGLHGKFPWPIDKAYKYPVKRIMELSIGFVPKIDEKTKKPVVERSLLWGREHYESEEDLLVASKSTASGSSTQEGVVPVSIIKANIPVQYTVTDLYSFLYNYGRSEEPDGTKVYEAAKLLETICYNELAKFAASANIEVDSEEDIENSLFGAGLAKAKPILQERIQSAADKQELGIKVVFLGLQGIHPTVEVSPDYQKVVGAVQKKQADILDADAMKNKTLSSLVGSVEDAGKLYSLAAQYRLAEEQNDKKQIDGLGEQLDAAFAQASGEIFATLRQSQAYSFEKATLAEATGKRFAGQLKAYRAAKDIYIRLQRLSAFEEALEKIRKYVVVADTNDTQIFIIDVQEKEKLSIYDLPGVKETKKK